MMRALTILSISAALTGAAWADDPWSGAWRGHAVDNRGDQFDIALRILPDGSTTLAYDGVFEGVAYHCDALLLATDLRGDAHSYREAIVGGGCINGGEVRVRRKAQDLQLNWRGEENGAPVTYSALLHR